MSSEQIIFSIVDHFIEQVVHSIVNKGMYFARSSTDSIEDTTVHVRWILKCATLI